MVDLSLHRTLSLFVTLTTWLQLAQQNEFSYSPYNSRMEQIFFSKNLASESKTQKNI